ncbi:hypothetical protein QTP86_022745 [Hemibagrus guttatus]|nr:hypothetical protein QTP86_022745 [Hemibagrus guttatus]
MPPPFISDEAIGKELSRYGRMVSPIKKIPLGLLRPTTSLSLLIQTLSVLDVARLDISLGPALRGRVIPVFLSDRGRTRPNRPGTFPLRPRSGRPPKGPGAAAAPDLTESEPQAQPAAQTPTGPSPPGKSHARPNRAPRQSPRSARPDRKKPWSTEKSSYTLNVTRDIVRSLKALEIEIVELQRLEATGDRGHIEALKSKKAKMNDLGYSSEWSGAQVVEDSFLVGLPKLSERAARELDRELSLEEFHEALQRMENGRASGIDGLPAEFYKAFWAVIGQDVLDVLRDSILRGNGAAYSPGTRRTVCLIGPYSIKVYLIRDILDVSRLLGLKTGLIFLDQEKRVLTGLSMNICGRCWKPLWVQPRFCSHDQGGCTVKLRVAREGPGLGQVGKRLVPKMSYRGRTLVINNLAASSLWHKLACVDPPPNLLANIQAQLVDFFWGGLHWIPQSVLHLPKEEGGQGVVPLSSRAAAFRLQIHPETPHWTQRPTKKRAVDQYTGCWRSLWYTAGDWTSPRGDRPCTVQNTRLLGHCDAPGAFVNVAGSDLSRAEDLAARMGLRSPGVLSISSFTAGALILHLRGDGKRSMFSGYWDGDVMSALDHGIGLEDPRRLLKPNTGVSDGLEAS